MGMPAFTLDIEDGAELATVRPRDGSLLLVERVSPTEVVLRLRPADGSQAASPAAAAAAAPASPESHAAAEAAAVTSEAQPASARSEGGAAETDGVEGDAERTSSNITAEQLSAAQSAVQRAIRGLTGPEAARVLDADGSSHHGGGGSQHHHGSGRGSTQISRQSSKETPSGSPRQWLSPDSTPTDSPRFGGHGRGAGDYRHGDHRHGGGHQRPSISTQSWNERSSSAGGHNWPAGSARRRSAGSLGRHSGGARSPVRGLAGGYPPAERDALSAPSGGSGADGGLRHGAPEWQQQQQRMQYGGGAGGQFRAPPPPPPQQPQQQRRHVPPPPPPPPRGRQPMLPTAAYGSPLHLLSQVKRGMDGEAALQQAQALMHRRALRNGALAATRPVTHEAFEFWHDEAGGSGLESHGSREGSTIYSDQQADEAAQAVAQWSAMRSSTASPAQPYQQQQQRQLLQQQQQQSQQFMQQQQQQQQQQRSQLHEPSLRIEDSAALDFGAQYGAQLEAEQQHQQQQQLQAAQRQQQQRQRPQWWAEPNSMQQEEGSGGDGGGVGTGSGTRTLKQDSWPPPPPPQAPVQEAALAAQQRAAEQAAQLAAHYGASLALQGSAGPASDLMRQLEEQDARRGAQPSPALPGPPGWAPASLNPVPRHARTGSGASEDLHAAATTAWQASGGSDGGGQHDLRRQTSDPPSSLGMTGGLGLSRFANMRTRALSDDDGRHTRPASAGVQTSPMLCEAVDIVAHLIADCMSHHHLYRSVQLVQAMMQEVTRAPAQRPSVRASSLQPTSPSAAADLPPSFAVSLADQVFQASKAWSMSSADAELLPRPSPTSLAPALPSAPQSATADDGGPGIPGDDQVPSDMPVFPINSTMFDFLDGDR